MFLLTDTVKVDLQRVQINSEKKNPIMIKTMSNRTFAPLSIIRDDVVIVVLLTIVAYCCILGSIVHFRNWLKFCFVSLVAGKSKRMRRSGEHQPEMKALSRNRTRLTISQRNKVSGWMYDLD